MYACQIYDYAKQQLPGVEEQIANGEFKPLRVSLQRVCSSIAYSMLRWYTIQVMVTYLSACVATCQQWWSVIIGLRKVVHPGQHVVLAVPGDCVLIEKGGCTALHRNG